MKRFVAIFFALLKDRCDLAAQKLSTSRRCEALGHAAEAAARRVFHVPPVSLMNQGYRVSGPSVFNGVQRWMVLVYAASEGQINHAGIGRLKIPPRTGEGRKVGAADRLIIAVDCVGRYSWLSLLITTRFRRAGSLQHRTAVWEHLHPRSGRRRSHPPSRITTSSNSSPFARCAVRSFRPRCSLHDSLDHSANHSMTSAAGRLRSLISRASKPTPSPIRSVQRELGMVLRYRLDRTLKPHRSGPREARR